MVEAFGKTVQLKVHACFSFFVNTLVYNFIEKSLYMFTKSKQLRLLFVVLLPLKPTQTKCTNVHYVADKTTKCFIQLG